MTERVWEKQRRWRIQRKARGRQRSRRRQQMDREVAIEFGYGWGGNEFDVACGWLEEEGGLCEGCNLPLKKGQEVAVVSLVDGPERRYHQGCLPAEFRPG
jgi:hypothetical protein